MATKGFRFNRIIRLFPGVRVNVSKRSTSLSLGRRGAWFTVGPRGTRATVGLPGTGISYTTTSHHQTSEQPAEPNTDTEVRAHPVWGWLIIVLAIGGVVALVRGCAGSWKNKAAQSGVPRVYSKQMSAIPGQLLIFDHEHLGATLAARRTLEIIPTFGNEKSRLAADPKRGRYLVLMATPLADHADNLLEESALLEWVTQLFARNDCTQLGIQYCVSPELGGKILALHKQHIAARAKV
jgi:hypothetical protein